jgi:hypothetical protein
VSAEEPFTGPPWAVHWDEEEAAYRDSLPAPVREMCMDAVFEIVTTKNPYVNEFSFPMRSSKPKGPHYVNFDNGRGWVEFVFLRRVEEPQIWIEKVFWAQVPAAGPGA